MTASPPSARHRRRPSPWQVTGLALGLSGAALAASDPVARIATSINPPITNLSRACLQAESDTRAGKDNSAQNIVTLRGGLSPVTWHGATPGLYRLCREKALKLEPLPSGKDLIAATTQQIALGGVSKDPPATVNWKVAFAMGPERVTPTIQDMSAWTPLGDGRWKGMNVYHFDPKELQALLKDGRTKRVPVYLLVYQNGKVSRWSVQ